MTTLTVRADIAPDGTLRLELPTDLPPGPAEVVIMVRSALPAMGTPGPK